jgi:hypothetical protein
MSDAKRRGGKSGLHAEGVKVFDAGVTFLKVQVKFALSTGDTAPYVEKDVTFRWQFGIHDDSAVM